MKTIKVELSEKDAAVLMMAVGLAIHTHGKYPYERQDGQEGYEEWREEHGNMCEAWTAITKAYADQTGVDGGWKDLQKIVEEHLPLMAKVSGGMFAEMEEIENNG